ncbi:MULTISPECIES: hypothetical protein [unclassified Actinotignum]|uniref:hypothetical protein n=1 Tax=unclassified Actinotignum TaxID=2632702 RepID=UPI002A825CC2|nr:hypothetical protein [Actinotignum sp. SLA_B059]MDY5127464.1 hypothetical protein [Actinotignum sp. SLA_B059]
MSGNIEFYQPSGMGLKLKGLRETLRALEDCGEEVSDLREIMWDIGMMILRAAQPLTPRSGIPGKAHILADSMKPGRAKLKATVYTVTRWVPYGAVIHYGWPKHHINPNPWLDKARNQNIDRAISKLTDAIGALLDKHGLENNL